MPTFQTYTRREYFQALIEHARHSNRGDSITLMTMNFDPGIPLLTDLMAALTAAARRGAEIRLIVDAMDFILDQKSKPAPLFYGRPLTINSPGSTGKSYAVLQELQAAGGHYWIINKPSRPLANPVAGRSHIKLALVNDRVFLGGCNLDDDSRVDIMVARKDAKTAAWLRELTDGIVAAGNVRQALQNRDLTHVIAPGMTLYVDCGVKRQSIIYTKALDVIDRAKQQVYITCQYFPGGPTAQHLLAARKRGAAVDIVFSGPKSHSQPLGHYLYNFRERLRMPASFFRGQLADSTPKMHAKIIATEQGAIIGSHNYVDIGIKLGTAEIALQYDNPSFAQQVRAAITRQLQERS